MTEKTTLAKRLAKDKGFTVSKLAEECKLDRATVSRILSGRMAPYPSQSTKIAQALSWTDNEELLFLEVAID